MRPDVLDLQGFYNSRQGQLVRRLVGRQIRILWPDLCGSRVLGLGYATPFLGPLVETAERVCAVMPPGQGVVRWPSERANLTLLASEDELPLGDRSIDRVLMVHALESAEQGRRMLREVWRVLADGGQALIIVPNRHGLWSLSESTPFGHGQPFSTAQLKGALRNTLFVPRESATALFVPPFRSRVMLRTALAWERVGLRWGKHFAGLLLMVAEKQIYATTLEPARAPRRVPRYLPVPRAAAAAKRVQNAARGRAASPADGAGTAPARSAGC
jgi:SAM-dependent methyltransferase